MIVKILPVFVCIMLSCVMTFSQFNDSIHHYVNFASTGIINKTNNGNSYVLTNGLRFNISKKNIRLNSTNSWIYGEQQNRLTNNDFNSTLDFNLYKTSSNFYYWGLANYDKSYSLKINNRLQAGVGGAYNIIDTTTAFLNVSDGILYETSNLKLNDSTNNSYSLFRNSFRLRYRFVIKDIIIFDGTNFFQNSLSDGNDYIIKSINSVSVKLRKWLNLTAATNYNRNQKTNSETLLITFGLTAEKYF
ncbi:DUF481 domain-containing protein [Segetibacter koreensis]|uniref:DUF481 domain-containing protein n=1 Tax=Segetibacter koreensis TaxID=398037 RepID=UPI000369D51A|nr:DUF481 domain-containing protein [Segetibacter koreensis]